MIFVLPLEYDQVTKITEDESGLAEELENSKPLMFYVMNNGAISKDKAIFERPNYRLQ